MKNKVIDDTQIRALMEERSNYVPTNLDEKNEELKELLIIKSSTSRWSARPAMSKDKAWNKLMEMMSATL